MSAPARPSCHCEQSEAISHHSTVPEPSKRSTGCRKDHGPQACISARSDAVRRYLPYPRVQDRPLRAHYKPLRRAAPTATPPCQPQPAHHVIASNAKQSQTSAQSSPTEAGRRLPRKPHAQNPRLTCGDGPWYHGHMDGLPSPMRRRERPAPAVENCGWRGK